MVTMKKNKREQSIALWNIFEAHLPLYSQTSKPDIFLLYNSYYDAEYVRKALSEVEVCASFPIAMFRPAKDESWDLCLKIFTGDEARPIHVFIDNKSREKEVREGEEILPRENEAQYRQTIKMTNFSHNGTLDVVHMYMRTHHPPSVVKNNLIKVGRDVSSRFMGPLSDLCYMSRRIASWCSLFPSLLFLSLLFRILFSSPPLFPILSFSSRLFSFFFPILLLSSRLFSPLFFPCALSLAASQTSTVQEMIR